MPQPRRASLAIVSCSALVLASPIAGAAPSGPPVDFARDVKPLLDAHCVSCHGPQKRKAELRLDTKRAALAGGLSGPVIVPGQSATSLFMRRIRGDDGEDRMPADKPPLGPAQIALLARWIDQGAPWPDDPGAAAAAEADAGPAHWAYRKPVRPPLPAVKAKAWVENPIDAFVLARLEAEGMRPTPQADRDTLLRRVTLDLTGLPPTIAEIDAFRADRAPGAYDRVVARLLASPHYGERWARPWLDLARYADSNGYEKDAPRVAWKYRDWVIEALNANMSFKRFTIAQIAGDMVPRATLADRIATGFHRNTLLNQEGGIDVEEARWETLVDRVGTTGTVWLGSTIACAQCHNHKYDPFSQKDFYRLLAFWDNGGYGVDGRGVDRWIVEPTLYLPDEEQRKKREALEAEIAAQRARLEVTSDEQKAAFRAWERSVREAEGDWSPLSVARAESRGGATLTVGKDGAILASGPNPESDEYEIEATTAIAAVTGIRIEVFAHPSLPGGGPGRHKDGNFFLSGFQVRASKVGDEGEGEPLKLKAAVGDESSGGGSRAENLLTETPDDGWAIDPALEPRPAKRQAVLVLDTPVRGGGAAGLRLIVRLVHRMPRQARNLGHFRLSVTGAADPTLAAIVPTRSKPALAIAPDKRTAEQRRELEELYGKVAASLKPVRRRIEELRKAIDDLRIPSALVLEEQPGFHRPATHLRVRGSFLNKGEIVYAGTPKILPPLPESQAPNRLGLAHWLVDEDNPLTARVTVNRFWAEYFGRGIVETTEDFGTQSGPPSHPELLDWLATEFMRLGWDMKALHRLIVTSATYRQSSRATPAALEKDPWNRLLGRGPRLRLEAEAVRDVALHAGGLLSRKIGGPSVFPPQPEGVWNVPYSSDKWVTSTGEDRYRRGLYTFIRRSAPYPSMVAFDAPSREACTPRRPRTNTPLQALVTLNDPVFFEAAQGLGARLVLEPAAAGDDRARAIHGFRLATGRTPRADEADALVAFYRRQKARYAKDPGAAETLVGASKQRVRARDAAAVAELAAWTAVGNVLLNLDETVTKE
jgi:mono/diheme cytochrome c family protein